MIHHSNTTNVKVKLGTNGGSISLIAIQIQPMLRLNAQWTRRASRSYKNSNTTNVKVKQRRSSSVSINSFYSNTTNVKVKPVQPPAIVLIPQNSNTTNVKVKPLLIQQHSHSILIQIQPMLRLNEEQANALKSGCDIQIQPMLRLNLQ